MSGDSVVKSLNDFGPHRQEYRYKYTVFNIASINTLATNIWFHVFIWCSSVIWFQGFTCGLSSGFLFNVNYVICPSER